MLEWIWEEMSLESKMSWLTESNARERLTAAMTVLLGGFLSLKPEAISWTNGSKADVVERQGRNPCCVALS